MLREAPEPKGFQSQRQLLATQGKGGNKIRLHFALALSYLTLRDVRVEGNPAAGTALSWYRLKIFVFQEKQRMVSTSIPAPAQQGTEQRR